jgi:hypothetical protein
VSSSKGHSAKKTPAWKTAVRLRYGALPFRESKAAGLEVLLVTSCQTKRWIILKGWPIRRLGPSKPAAREAYEGAGVHEDTRSRPIGKFLYSKLLGDRVRQQFRHSRQGDIHEAPDSSAGAGADTRRVNGNGPKQRLDLAGPLITQSS